MAVGVVYAGMLTGGADISAAGALALSLGIAIQNFRRGPSSLCPCGRKAGRGPGPLPAGWPPGWWSRWRPAVTLLAAELVVPALPWLLAFAAGAMLYVVWRN